jgi:hypothetical protein
LTDGDAEPLEVTINSGRAALKARASEKAGAPHPIHAAAGGKIT